MLIPSDKIKNVPILSLQTSSTIAYTDRIIIDPDNFKVLGFTLSGGIIGNSSANILDVRSVRELSNYGMVIDSADEFVEHDDIEKIRKVLELDFELIGLDVVTKKGSKLGKVSGFMFGAEDSIIHQIIVKRPIIKSLFGKNSVAELVISRNEIVEVNDTKIIVKDEEKTLMQKAENEDFIPNFVNPFRKNPEQDFAPAQNQNPGE